MLLTLSGTIVSSTGEAVPAAAIRLVSSQYILDGVEEAAVVAPKDITWTRLITGFNSHRWNCWVKYVDQEVSGITWPEFRDQVLVYNPSLDDTGNIFQPNRTYIIPENRNASGGFIWQNKELGNVMLNRWRYWKKFVSGKIVGLTWTTFKDEVVQRNPHLINDGYIFLPNKIYQLPRSTEDMFYLYRGSEENGTYQFNQLPPGLYQVEIQANGYKTKTQSLTLNRSQSLNITLKPLSPNPIPEDFAQVQDGQFYLNGSPLKFIGANIRGLLYYGYDTTFFPYAQTYHRIVQLESANQMGVRVARVFLAHKDYTPTTVGDRLQEVITLLDSQFPNIYLIPALTNFYNDVPFYVQGDDIFFESGSPNILGRQFFVDGYTQNYLPFVQYIVNRFKDSPRIFAWDIGNELKVNDDPDLFVQFNQTIADAIRTIDTNHLITTGMISTRHAYMENRQDLRLALYGAANINFITNHVYNGNEEPPEINDDSDLIAELNLPLIVEEAGFDSSKYSDRPQKLEGDLAIWFDQKGASGYMQWGFMGTDTDIGDGDIYVGMDRVLHGDWDGLFTAYQARSQILLAKKTVVGRKKPKIHPKPF